MKKYLLLLLSGWFFTSITNAQSIDRKTAAATAANVLHKSVVPTENLTAEVRSRLSNLSYTPAFYVFNAEDGQGFVIVSGDERMPEVMAYSRNGQFDAENMPPALIEMLDAYTEVVNDVRKGETTVEKPTLRFDDAQPIVGPLCRSQWGQNDPYNTLCPEKNGEKCPVGCVATALAQIMYHFSWPVQGEGSNRYASGISGVGLLSSNFYEHTYEWDVMKTTKRENAASAEAANAVAQLSYDCGIATRMKYDPEGSGTNDDLAMVALYTNFRYRASTLRIERRNCYATQEEWDNLVKSELDANRPVLYAGFNKSGGGHEFIIDGYDDAGFFHLNWGWDGSSDAWYSIVTLHPTKTSFSFSEDQSMVCGIEPDQTGEDTIPHQFRIYMEEAPTVTVETIPCGSSFAISLNSVFNYSRTANTWAMGVALYNLDGEQLAVISPKYDGYTENLLSLKGYSHYTCSAIVPEDIPNGIYAIKAAFCQKGYEEYILPDMVGGQALNTIIIEVKDGTVYFNAEIPAGIHPVDASTTIIAHDYYDVTGKRIGETAKGIIIDRQTLSCGKQVTKKIVR
ncbi:MAG: C10 family peptidase [Bacteroidaceae bacterium]|nr:C10 family peptidase [Bacteroidaceae bacterium]